MRPANLGLIALAAASIVALGTMHCGDGDGGGSGSARIAGNVSDVPGTARAPGDGRTWLAWIGEELVGLARDAFAQAGLGGIQVTARRGGTDRSDITDEDGDFDIPGAPAGDVQVVFRSGDCEADAGIPDVTNGSTVTLEDVDISDCDTARPGRVLETFDAVVQNKPGSPNGNLNVCVESGGETRTRVVKIQSADFEDGGSGRNSFDELEEGDRITAIGIREGLGAPSALDADTIRILASGNPGDCDVLLTPTPTGTPGPTATPEPTPNG